VAPAQFEELCRTTPTIRDHVMACLVHKLIEASRRVVEMAEITAGVRVMRELARAATAFGQAEDGGVIRLTQEQVACLAGAGIRSTSQALAVARKSGAIETHKRQIRVLNWNALLSAAEIAI
jgi:CRP-like cAMP-binding protein